MVDKTIEELVLDFTASRYPGHSFVLLFGSASCGQQNSRSDIDVIVVYREPIQCFREKVNYRGALFDVFVYDLESINTHIHMARSGGNATMLEIILTAHPLPLQTKDFELLQHAAHRIKSLPPLAQDTTSVRQYLTSCIDDLKSSSDSLESKAIAIEIYRVIEDAILMAIGSGGFRKKYAARAIKSHDTEYYTRTLDALKKSLDGENEQIISVGEELLEQFGGELREGYFRSLPEVVRMPLPVI